jgi:tRNA(His) 5'-end guanylyltransferase
MQALLLMNECAKAVLEDISDVVFCYGVSDEYRSLHSSDVWVLQYVEFGVCVCVCVFLQSPKDTCSDHLLNAIPPL